ncbi:MFS myo-inositol transporter [Drepanopeziza brunnea f. sp. 'multigermtubi' MB_m1]|uniref:MFS myo-inositol transporter n=1 Tax=Marssonina brunnea f. sp. multigermtubi (strain MB_m1) TaxID=1072389 RepID=K1W8E0_MARBU|nr:MFS myo-inositol transporter [Drepanopeziza brunnea f. sp. 'multigermtubi' MB_m1]EKD13455.1 MFS myo-inositol transporter [Drepanopeziza brunnea f. sp. 'multigermtubi' MB_m1]
MSDSNPNPNPNANPSPDPEKHSIQQDSISPIAYSSSKEGNIEDAGEVPIALKLKNPLAGMTREELLLDVEAFAREKELEDVLPLLKKGALVAQAPKTFESIEDLSEDEKGWLRKELTHRWTQPNMMYYMTILCAGSAIVQGMDQTSVNGAQTFYFEEFNIGPERTWLRGLLNGAPYLCSAAIGCWTTKPLNYYFGRRGCIFISCVVSFVTGIWMAAANSWPNLLVSRFALGLAVGAKSSTTPVYAAECAPTAIRGALTMMWQMWTAFGIMLGFIVSVAFQNVGYTPGDTPYWNWRLMLGSTSIPPFFVCLMVYLVPESPRWYMTKNKYRKAYEALCKFRNCELMAARDVYYIHKSLLVEEKLREGKNLWSEFFKVPRNRRAAQSSFFVMFMQQFCGVNVIAYYSTEIFISANFSRPDALLVSMGTGIVNWIFALPAVYTIDTFGRRNLLLTTFPLMGLCLLFVGFSFYIDAVKTRLACVATGIYLFMVVYSPGEGPVPFTYSAEAFPLYVREYGMAFATATTWGFNFILSLTWPSLVDAFTPQGAFGWYAAWNFFGWAYAYFFLQETKGRSLEELDVVFNMSVMKHARYYSAMLPWYFNKWILRGDVPPRKPLHDMDE